MCCNTAPTTEGTAGAPDAPLRTIQTVQPISAGVVCMQTHAAAGCGAQGTELKQHYAMAKAKEPT
jgi:hypothetical protein